MAPSSDSKTTTMLSVPHNTSKRRKVIPNVLPCSIKHNAPVNAAQRYWKPEKDGHGHSTAYFRGRKLRGRTIKIPDGYHGVVLEKTDKDVQAAVLPPPLTEEDFPSGMGDGQEDDLMPDEVQIDTKETVEKARFEEVVVWGHEALPDDDDPYVKGIEEWVAFAEAMHKH